MSTDRPPRCKTTIVHFADPQSRERTGEYTIPSNPWGRHNLTYSIINNSGEPVTSEVKTAIADAFYAWQEALGGDFTFTLQEGEADITIIFYSDEPHPAPNMGKFSQTADNDQIVLAHAFYPLPENRALMGHIHFNALAPWNGASETGYNLTSVAMHEIGHVLGLAHSESRESIMFEDYSEWRNGLAKQDVDNIRSLYLQGGSVTVPGLVDPRGGGVSAELVVAPPVVKRLV